MTGRLWPKAIVFSFAIDLPLIARPCATAFAMHCFRWANPEPVNAFSSFHRFLVALQPHVGENQNSADSDHRMAVQVQLREGDAK
jgi:hypothetical protein